MITNCCPLYQDIEEDLSFLKCINESITYNSNKFLNNLRLFHQIGPSLGVGIVTFATSDIWDYASLSLAVNGAYAEYNNYIIKLIDPSISNPDPNDSRWSKVKLLLDALEENGDNDENINGNHGWARDLDYIMWIDADLIFLDLNLRLEQIAALNPTAHIIVSAEHAGSTTMINSGSVLVRNTAWSRDFLNKWWNYADRRLYSDQEQFDMLYNSLKGGDGALDRYIKILPPDAINTDPPAMTNLKKSNQVLHLMGEHTLFRKTVFGYAFETICNASNINNNDNNNWKSMMKLIPTQFGLSSQMLLDWTLNTYGPETNERMNNFKHKINTGGSSLREARYLSNAVHHYAHALTHRGLSEDLNIAISIRNETYNILLENIKVMRSLNDLYLKNNGRVLEDWPELLKNAVEAGSNVMHSNEISIQYRHEIAQSMEVLFDEMLHICHKEQRPAVLTMKAHFIIEVGHLYRLQELYNDALKYYEDGLNLSKQLIPIMGEHIIVESLSFVATMLATLKREKEALPLFDSVISIATKSLGTLHYSVAQHMVNAGIAKIQLGMNHEAQLQLEKAIDILKIHGLENDFVYQRALESLDTIQI